MIFRIIKVEVRGYQQNTKAEADNLYRDFDYSVDIAKTESSNCFIINWTKKKVLTASGTDNLFLNVQKYANQQAAQSGRT